MNNFYVFDTNVIISSVIFPRSIPQQSLNKALNEGTVLVSVPIINELTEVLNRKKFDRYLSFEARNEFLENLTLKTFIISIDKTIQICRDPKDDKFLELAVCGSADFIISGDRDLLELNPFRGTRIITPQNFLN